MDTGRIKSFEVKGLFGTHDISMSFDEKVKILIGENGVGKTQMLNLFYYTLTCDFAKLIQYRFDFLKITFLENKEISINKKEVESQLKDIYYQHPIVEGIIESIGFLEFEKLLQDSSEMRRSDFNQLIEKIGINYHYLEVKQALRRIDRLSDRQRDIFLQQKKDSIERYTKDTEILYFPTYRRVEEDLYNLDVLTYKRIEEDWYDGKPKVSSENNLIQFGMDDVKRRFNDIENTIDKLLKEGLAQFTKDILTVVVDESDPDKEIFDKINEDDLEIILSRVGNQIPDAQKKAVKDAVSKNEIKNPLSIYLLQKLVEIYEKQKELDNSVKVFRDVCNNYLINKEIFYDESDIEIYAKSTITGEKVDLRYLSSGEKQIISIFSKVYLAESDQRFMILFDEPELSLSMEWQKQLLPDIMNSNKCDFLLAVTHSPFIFDNELDGYAVGINEYISTTEVTPQA